MCTKLASSWSLYCTVKDFWYVIAPEGIFEAAGALEGVAAVRLRGPAPDLLPWFGYP
jgi:hypothetical protein